MELFTRDCGCTEGADDPGFLSDLIDKISADYNIGRSRRCVTGISNGGFMAQRLGCEVDGQFAGFASIAAGGYAAMPESCRRDAPIDAFYAHGTADKLVPWEGLRIRNSDGSEQLVTLSITQSLKYWANHNHFSPDVSVSDLLPSGRSPGTSVRIFASSDCAASTDVRLYAVIGGGHNWPGVANAIAPSIAGRVNLDIHASEVEWSFFDRNYSSPSFEYHSSSCSPITKGDHVLCLKWHPPILICLMPDTVCHYQKAFPVPVKSIK